MLLQLKNNITYTGIMILVFKTSVRTNEDVVKLSSHLNNLSQDIKWNFDLEDRDNILKIVSSHISAKKVIEVLCKAQYACDELD